MGKTKYSLNLNFFGIGVGVEFEEERLFLEMRERWFESQIKKEDLRVEIKGLGRKHEIVSGEVKKETSDFKEGEIKPDFSYEDYVDWLVKVVLQERLIDKKVLFLHASGVINKEGKVVAVVGKSGAGKSTFVSNFSRERVIGDDVVVVKIRDEGLRVTRVWEKHKSGVGFIGEVELEEIDCLSWGERLEFQEGKKREVFRELMASVYWSGNKVIDYTRMSLKLLRLVEVRCLRVPPKFKSKQFLF